MNRVILIIPLLTILLISSFVLVYLLSNKDPNKPPSALLNKDIPKFSTISLFNNNVRLSSENIIRNVSINNENIEKKFTLINFFASWCTPCKVEHPLFFTLGKDYPNLFILGINHKDNKNDALKYLLDDGNPYNFVGVDEDGLIALEFGVFGLPETFLIDAKGTIIYKITGPLTKDIIENEIEPLL
tara:strand:+ start:96 stop:653 length:558 start_codon:yes stop_codon:yes gene_type:complete